MSERKRFRARYTHDPGVEVGARVLFHPGVLFEEWSTGVLQRPERLAAVDPRPGDVIKIIEPAPRLGRTWWDVWAEDPAPHVTTVEVILTVIGERVLATPGPIKALLEHLCSEEIRNDVEGAEVAAAVTPWLEARFPGLARAAEIGVGYDEPPEIEAWIEGVACALGHWPYRQVTVPVPPFTFTREPDPKPEPGFLSTTNLRVRPDAVNRLYGGHRAN